MKLAKKLGLTIESLPILVTTDKTVFAREFDLVDYEDKTAFIAAANKSMTQLTGLHNHVLIFTNFKHQSSNSPLINKNDIDENLWLWFKKPHQGCSVYAAYVQCVEPEDYTAAKSKLPVVARSYMGYYPDDETLLAGYLEYQKLMPDLFPTIILDIDLTDKVDMSDIGDLIKIEIPNFDNHFFLPLPVIISSCG